MEDKLGDRMKMLENIECDKRFMPLLPICARLDGKCFSNFTRGLKKPFDDRIINLMVETTKYLVTETNANMGYTASDEISLMWYSPNYKSQIFLDGRVQKMISILASMTTVKFVTLLPLFLPEKVGQLPIFDCRVWTVPTLFEATNTFLWRELDATKNSITTLASTVYSDKELFKKNGSEKQEMLFKKGINWNDYPDYFKRGTFIQRRKVSKKFTCEEITKLPPQHEAHNNPDLTIERSEVRVIDMPPFSQVINRDDVIFNGADPKTEFDLQP